MAGKKVAGIFIIILALNGCASSQAGSDIDELDKAIRGASDYLNSNLPHGNKLAILNFQSKYSALSEYVIEELIANTVNDRIFTVVDRENLELIRQETEFQLSGDVTDETAVSIGKKLGAQTIVSGSVSQIGNLYRLRVRALDVRTAQIQGQFNSSIANSPTIAILIQSVAEESSVKQKAAEPDKIKPNVAVITNETVKARPEFTYKIGDKGPAGGYIFYDKGNNRGGWRYLEAAPEDTERTLPFKIRGNGPFGRKTGDGKENSESHMASIKQDGGGVNTVVWYCDELVVNGYDDWYVPTTDELMYIYNNLYLKDIGGFSKDKYWSSMFNSKGELWVDFSNGEEDGSFFGWERLKLKVRPVRRF